MVSVAGEPLPPSSVMAPGAKILSASRRAGGPSTAALCGGGGTSRAAILTSHYHFLKKSLASSPQGMTLPFGYSCSDYPALQQAVPCFIQVMEVRVK